MQRAGVGSLPLYPEERRTPRPTADQILRLFALVERHVVTVDGQDAHVVEPRLTPLQAQILALLGVPEAAFRRRR